MQLFYFIEKVRSQATAYRKSHFKVNEDGTITCHPGDIDFCFTAGARYFDDLMSEKLNNIALQGVQGNFGYKDIQLQGPQDEYGSIEAEEIIL